VKHFSQRIINPTAKLPGKTECLKAAEDHSSLLLEKINRKWSIVKDLIYARQQGMKRKLLQTQPKSTP
jgi:hypothetical protein